MFILKPQKEYALIDAGNGFKLERYGEYLIARPDPQALWPKAVFGIASLSSSSSSMGSGSSVEGIVAGLRVGSDNLNLWPHIDAVFAKAGYGGGSGRGGSKDGSRDGSRDGFRDRVRSDGSRDSRVSPGLDEEDEDRGNWIKTRDIPERWPVKFDMGDGLPALNVYARLTPFKHTGIFPEQFTNWKWSMELISKALGNTLENDLGKALENTPENALENIGGNSKMDGKTVQNATEGNISAGRKFSRENPPKILNLFGYSGVATIACLLAGAHVTHVDSSKGAITWANENAELSGVLDKPVRWILEDAVSFIKKEIRRGNKYDGIILDPPAFGRGAKGEVWKIEKDFLPFLELIFELLSEDALFLILNGYAAGYSSIAYAQNLRGLVDKKGGIVEHGELCIEQSLSDFGRLIDGEVGGASHGDGGAGKNGGDKNKSSKRTSIVLPCGIVARWKSE